MTSTQRTPLTQTPNFLKLQPVPSLVGGDLLVGSTSDFFDVIRPEKGPANQKVHSVVGCTPDDATAAVDAAAAAFPAWKATPYEERRKVFLRASELLQQRAQEYAQLTVEETCLDLSFATFEILNLAVPGLEETAAVITTALRGEFPRLHESGRRELIQREPYGVVVGIVSRRGS